MYMNHQPNHVNTDRAWSLHHARLREEGLIGDKAPQTSGKPRRLPAAALLIVCAAALTLLLRKGGEANDGLLILHNEKGALTLATTLEDGSIVYLADDTQLHYPEHFMPHKREVSLKGEALFDVKGKPERPFLVTAGEARIEVSGTAFNVLHTDSKPLELSVWQGEVKVVLGENGRSMHARAGQTLRLASSGHLSLEQTPGDTPAFSHYKGGIRFKDEKLSDILEVINRKGGGLILRATPGVENRKITATFLDDTPESVAGLICAAFNLACEKENNILLISEP